MSVLKKICELKLKEIQFLKEKKKLKLTSKKTRGFLKKLIEPTKDYFNVIAEIKRSSPSKGIICKNFNLEKIATDYEAAGVKCISVLTENNYFGGDISFINTVKKVIKIPVLRKDFIIDEWQIYESLDEGADCILLIFAILNDTQIKRFYKLSTEIGMDVICEVHNKEELKRALKLGVNCIGINNRNLKTLEINHETFNNLSSQIPKDIIKICESGISAKKQLEEYSNVGADAFLIGETLMGSSNILEKTKKMIKK